MNQDNRFSLSTIIDKIKADKILLPDFQRSFVWKQEDRQKALISSVLSKMPIGSILLLEGDSNEFAVRKIGMKETYSADTENVSTIDYLLDGQQRMTVLACSFSNVIFDIEKSDKSQTIISKGLQRRFFLKFPKFVDLTDEAIYFGAKSLKFPYDINKYDAYPDFIAGDIMNIIVSKPFSKSKKSIDEAYNPYYKASKEGLESKELKDWCIKNSDGFYIPLYLLNDDNDRDNLLKIIKEIAKDYGECIYSSFEKLATDDEKDEQAKKFLNDDSYAEYEADVSDGKQRDKAFEEQIKEMTSTWAGKMKDYLVSCVTNLHQIMSIIEVKKSQRERAIDIYENLNKGGISLSVFDLVTAKASLHENNKDFNAQINEIINEELDDSTEAAKYRYIKIRDRNDCYINSTYLKNCQCLETDSTFNSKFIDVFLNVLSIYANSYEKDESQNTVAFGTIYINLKGISIENTKRKAKLELDKDDIYNHFRDVCNGVDRALLFLKCRCGVKKINDIPYNHVLSILSLIFINDKYFADKKIHELLEAWYWSIMFSGEFDKDQNTQFIKHLTKLLENLNDYKTGDLVNWIKSLSKGIFNREGFSDKDKLLVKDGTSPKGSIKNAILQYYLSKNYQNFSTKDKNSPYSVTINAYTDDVYNDKKKYKLEAHHIIPLNTMEEYDKNKRSDRDFYGNSPLNLLYIVSEDNKDISDDDVSVYLKKIDTENRRALDLFYSDESIKNDEIDSALKYDDTKKRTKDDVMNLLSIRFDLLKNSVSNEISRLLKFDAASN